MKQGFATEIELGGRKSSGGTNACGTKKDNHRATAAGTIAGATAALPGAAYAQHWHGGGWHRGGGGHGGFGWGGFALGVGTGLALGAPYYGGYYGPYAYDYPYAYAYGGDCVMRRPWVINAYGHPCLALDARLLLGGS